MNEGKIEESAHGSFEVDNRWGKELEVAIKNSPKQKAVGADLCFVEELKIRPKMIAEFLLDLWQCCGRVRAIPEK